ncbi:hypothetical protein KXJ72_17435 (plasmid) [Comamonas aquatica]|nr:hypothetical protein KXJ72_17435 [Comamonas aquatica]
MMKISVVTAFGLWGLVSYSAITIALAGTAGLDTGIAQGNVMAVQSASYSLKDASMLFVEVGSEVKPIANGQIKLTGILYSTEAGASLALFSIEKSPAKAYRIGAELPNGMKVVAVNKRQVVLSDSDGGQVEIDLPKQ